MTISTSNSASKTTSPLSPTKEVPCKAHLSSKIFTEQFRRASIESVRRAQDHVLGYRSIRSSASRAERQQRCQNLVDEALSALNDSEDVPTAATSQTPAVPQDVGMTSSASPPIPSASPPIPSAESLYGYDDYSPVTPRVSKMPGRRRYQRRCSVTEFSLKAAVLAKVQLGRRASIE